MHHSKNLKFGLLLLLLCLLLPPAGGYAQADGEDDEPGLLERFIAIFNTPPPEPALTIDSLPIPPDLTQEYWRTYNLIHRKQEAFYRNLADSSHTTWDELTGLDGVEYSREGDTLVLAKNLKVFGWHPHWMGSAYKNYRFKLLSHVSLFSYNLRDGQGEPYYDNPEVVISWESEDFELVKLAHADNCKVMITVSSFGWGKNKRFLDDPERQEGLIEDVIKRMVAIEADGIDLDFELVPVNYEKQLTAFILRVKQQLIKVGEQYELSVVLPKVNGSKNGKNLYNVKLLQKSVDFFTLTAYDFTNGSYASGPISPLYDDDPTPRSFKSIEDIVYNYLEDSLDRKKLLLGLPYYGGKWSRFSNEADESDSLAFQHPTYSAIIKANRRNGPPGYDEQAVAAYYIEEGPAGVPGFDRRKDITWFDDFRTMGIKYDWVLEQGLGGIGIWALGYDGTQPELWGLMGEKFTPTTESYVYHQPEQSIWNVPLLLSKYGDLFGISGLFIFAFLAIGFVVALFDWRVRDVFFKNKTLRLLYIVA